MTNDIKALAEQYFNSYPKENVIYISSDGQVFLQANHSDGYNHQRRIDEKTPLIAVRRADLVEKPEQEDDDTAEDTPTEKSNKDQIIKWLSDKEVELTGKETKSELLDKVTEVLAAEEEEEDDLND